MVEQQPVFAPPRHDVQPEPDFPQEGLSLFQSSQLGRRQEAASGQSVERIAAEMTFGDPGNGLNVAQAAGSRLDVRLEVVGRVVRLEVAFSLLADLGLEESLHRPHMIRRKRRAHADEQGLVAGQQPCFEQRGHDADLSRTFLCAFFNGPHAVSGFQSDVPEESDQPLYGSTPLRIGRFRDQQHDVDVGTGVQLPAAIAADGQQRPLTDVGNFLGFPNFPQNAVDEEGARVDQVLHGLLGEEADFQLFVCLTQQLAIGRGGTVCLGNHRRHAIEQRPGNRPCRGWEDVLQEVQIACSHCVYCRRPPAPKVSTSTPSSVTSTVCSHWADKEWSFVITVHPSGKSRTCRFPALTIGSTVKVIPALISIPVPNSP